MAPVQAFAAALSEHPDTAQAVGEAVGQVADALRPDTPGQGLPSDTTSPDLALLFVTPTHADQLEQAAEVVRATLSPSVLIGCSAESVVGTGREVEQGPALCLWAGKVGQVSPFSLEPFPGELGPSLSHPATGEVAPGGPVGWPGPLPFEPRAVLLLADPYSFPVDQLLRFLEDAHPGLPVIGGLAQGGPGPTHTRLLAGDSVRRNGAVGALLGEGVEVAPLVSQGCRPIGHPLVVTKAEGNVIYELAGHSALDRLLELAESGQLSPEELLAINRGGLHVGRVIDEHKDSFGQGDFLIRNVIGADRDQGAIAVSEVVEIGTTFQYHLRDAETADEELRNLLDGQSAGAALLFTCNGRGTRMFGHPHHDATALSDALGEIPVAGFFAAGELGPVGGRNFVHGFTASVALLGKDGDSVAPLQEPIKEDE
ncbi:MAG: FIST C-terminal domain-containing protein [Acidimicrobiales bacterium]|nr:FIST C-terminal domain-containing protein [Acidimicrobiales bacterium]